MGGKKKRVDNVVLTRAHVYRDSSGPGRPSARHGLPHSIIDHFCVAVAFLSFYK